MAEQLKRDIQEILEELFKGKNSALEKYAKVRHTRDEICRLYMRDGLPLYEINRSARIYFSKRFLGGVRISDASQAELREGLKRLDHAVRDGCRPRCLRLVAELNGALKELGLDTVKSPDKFLNWLTFCYEVKLGCDGKPVLEPGYNSEIRIFCDKKNREMFWAEIVALLKEKKMMSMTDVLRIVRFKRKKSKCIKRGD